MSNQSNKSQSNSQSLTPEMVFEMQWQSTFNQLCYEVFYLTEKGQQLLRHLELKYFRSPVAFPNQDPAWAFFNEGHCELIRSFTKAMQNHMNKQNG